MSELPEFQEWRESAIEALARAWYRADGFRGGGVTPRWEMVDRVIQEAWRKAARRYVNGGRLRRPRLIMRGDKWEDRTDADLWSELIKRRGEPTTLDAIR